VPRACSRRWRESHDGVGRIARRRRAAALASKASGQRGNFVVRAPDTRPEPGSSARDVLWAVSMKYADGYSRLGWSILSLLLLAAFVFLLGRSLQVLPVGTAYAVWTGIGAIGTVLMSVVLFGESFDVIRLGCIGLVLIGIVGLKLQAG
jgi:quaternary ammonium compound-resistance protein SugE